MICTCDWSSRYVLIPISNVTSDKRLLGEWLWCSMKWLLGVSWLPYMVQKPHVLLQLVGRNSVISDLTNLYRILHLKKQTKVKWSLWSQACCIMNEKTSYVLEKEGASHGHSWERWWSATFWVALQRLSPHSFLLLLNLWATHYAKPSWLYA
jgi:hypothetical protein